MVTGKFIGLDAATLTEMQADWKAALKAIAVGNQSYTIAGRTFTRANLSEVAEMVAEINRALTIANGGITTTYADMSSGG